jgi:hypothetical protein
LRVHTHRYGINIVPFIKTICLFITVSLEIDNLAILFAPAFGSELQTHHNGPLSLHVDFYFTAELKSISLTVIFGQATQKEI